MAAWQEPWLDWSGDDYFNAEDANRIESNTEAARDLLAAKFPPAPALDVQTDRAMQSLDYASSLNRIEGNIDALRLAFFPGIPPDRWEQAKTDWQAGQPFDWRDARRLERNLARLHYYLTVSGRVYRYCGTFSSGQPANGL